MEQFDITSAQETGSGDRSRGSATPEPAFFQPVPPLPDRPTRGGDQQSDSIARQLLFESIDEYAASTQTKTNDHTSASFDDPDKHIEKASKVPDNFGVEFKIKELDKAVNAAEKIDQNGVLQDRYAVFQQALTLEDRLSTAPDGEKAGIRALLNTARQKEQKLLRFHLAPATARIERAIALLKTGKPENIRRAEADLKQAFTLRPELEGDAQTIRRIQEARTDSGAGQGNAPPGPPGDQPPADRPPQLQAQHHADQLFARQADKIARNFIADLENEEQELIKHGALRPEDDPEFEIELGDTEKNLKLKALLTSAVALMILARVGWKLYKKGSRWFARRAGPPTEGTQVRSRTEPEGERGRESRPPASEANEGRPEINRGKVEPALAQLSAKKDINGLNKFARSTGDRHLAEEAVQAMIDCDPPGLMEHLRELSRGDSHAASFALSRLVTMSETDSDDNLLSERWRNGDILRLWREGKVNAGELLSAIDILNMSGEVCKTLLDKLSDRGELKAELCREMLGRDLFLKGQWNMRVDAELRLAALDYLASRGGSELGRILLDTQEIDDPVVVKRAHEHLARLWSTERQPEGSRQRINELLVGERLERFARDLAVITWPERSLEAESLSRNHKELLEKVSQQKRAFGTALDKYLRRSGFDPERWEEISQQIDDNWTREEKMRELLKDAPEALDEYRKLRQLEKDSDSVREKLDQALEPRRQVLQDYLRKVAKEMGLPEPTLALVDSWVKNANGDYSPGRGEITVLERFLLGSAQPRAGLISLLAHEFGHLEQDTLMLRRMADLAGVGRTATDGQLARLKELYRQKSGWTEEISDEFLKRVLELRDGRTLTEGEMKRADRLLKALKDLQTAYELDRNLRIDIDRLERVKRGLSNPENEFFTLFGHVRPKDQNCMERVKKLLRVKELPPDLAFALERWVEAYRNKSADAGQLQKEVVKIMLQHIRWRIDRLNSERDKLYRERMHEVETHEVGRRAKYFAEKALASVTPFTDAQKRALDKAGQIRAMNFRELAFVNSQGQVRRQVVEQLLRSCLDALDESTVENRFSEADRTELKELIADYKSGKPAVIDAVHRYLGLVSQTTGRQDTGPTLAEGQPPQAPDGANSGERNPASIREMERMLAVPENRARRVAELLDKGPIRETLVESGMGKEPAARLEKELLCEQKEVRARALREIARHYRARGGIRGFAREARGRLGAFALVTAALLPFLFSSNDREEPYQPATWRGGGGR